MEAAQLKPAELGELADALVVASGTLSQDDQRVVVGLWRLSRGRRSGSRGGAG